MTVDEAISSLRSHANPKNVQGMARFGIHSKDTLGVPMPTLRSMAKRIGKDHELATGLWKSGIHEARILAALTDDPRQVTEKQMEEWAGDLDSWDVCDQVCGNLFDKTEFGYKKAIEWSRRTPEFVKRAGFVLMAELAVHDKTEPNESFLVFFPFIREGATDSRNFVTKAVNWALRQIGKRNMELRVPALELARELAGSDIACVRWVGKDAVRELQKAVR